MLVSAKERFTLLGYGFDDRSMSGLSEPSQHSGQWTVYVCPTCRTQTGFEWTGFNRHTGSAFSNLKRPEAQEVEPEVGDKLANEPSFLDFYCPGCAGALRVYFRYEPAEEKVRGERLELKMVIERTARRKEASFDS